MHQQIFSILLSYNGEPPAKKKLDRIKLLQTVLLMPFGRVQIDPKIIFAPNIRTHIMLPSCHVEIDKYEKWHTFHSCERHLQLRSQLLARMGNLHAENPLNHSENLPLPTPTNRS